MNKTAYDDIFVIPVLDQHLVYTPLNGQYALLNGDAVLLLRDSCLNGQTERLSSEFRELLRQLCLPPVRPPEKTGPMDPPFLGIIPSRRCNMACSYCDFGALEAPSEILDPEKLISAIDWFALYMEKTKRKHLPIQFFGGEPFIEKEIMDIAVHHARLVGSRTGLVPRFEASSNGYYGKTTRVFIRDYFDRIVISLDGFQKHHDRTRASTSRCGSFKTVADTVRYLSTQSLDLAVRCCITSDSVRDMEGMALWFCREFHPSKVNFETLTRNSCTKAAELTPPDPYLFAEHGVKSWRILRKHGVEPAYAPIALDHPQTTSCPVGRDVPIVHPDGLIAACYLQPKDWQARNMDLSVGSVGKNGKVDIDPKRLTSFRNMLEDKPRCRDCFCRFGCAGGCHVNNTFPGSQERYTDFCIATRIMTACRLLEEMGMESAADEWLADKNALGRMARSVSDRLAHFDL